MNEKSSATEQAEMHAAEQEDIMQHVQGMIENLLKSAVDKVHKEEHNKHLGGTHTSADTNADETPQMGIAEVKNFVSVMQKFIDNVNIIIAQLETGQPGAGGPDDKFLDGYMATADTVLEIAAFSMKDPLTGLSNRSGFENRLILEWNRATRDKSALGLFIFGLDGLEECEDNKKRDDYLKAVAKTVELSIKRTTDFIARWSDNEFAALLPITDESGALIVAERIRSAVDNMNLPGITDDMCKSTVSIGVCDHAPEHVEKPIDFINHAHEAYEKAKEKGGNAIVFI